MPGNKHLRGVSSKEQRQYEHIKESAEKSGRYGSRAKEVAARTVIKEHKQKGHRKGHSRGELRLHNSDSAPHPIRCRSLSVS